ncbi:DUF2487 family protein [Ammoniphilus sp. YIM 78166]|uniref:DUF2487 family protein n=1 Tax=Ammoniphilus sp. YIM 78166 TaxID=1644106 RepID=UPI0010706192|nr:DUF2487 family protein [Ammoniphilus sp. YIM 78166]
MRWTLEDMKTYEGAKEYIDTALIPIYYLSPSELGVAKVQEQRWMEEICVYAERQLTGRIVLFPTLYLLKQETESIPPFQADSFPHVLFVTTEESMEKSLAGLNFSAYFLERKEDEEDLSVMVKEGKKLTQKIMELWKK